MNQDFVRFSNLRRHSLIATATIALLAGSAGTAFAQDAATAAGDEASTGDIVVTGQRRAESSIKAAVAVTAFSAETITAAGITSPGDFLKLAPNVTFVQSNNPGEMFVSIRGNTAVRTGESSVALVMDGVQQIDANGLNQELFDLEQIEILKGPQGALYGRNAIGGAIVIRTKAPSFTDFEGLIKVGAANGGEHKGQAVVSGPLSETLAFRAGMFFNDRRGYYENKLTGENVDRYRNLTGFGRLLWKPTDNFTVDLNSRITRIDGGGIYWNGLIVGLTAPALDGDNTSIPWTANIPGTTDNKRRNFSLKMDYELPFATITSTTAYAYLMDNYGADSFPYVYDPGKFYDFFLGANAIGLGAQTQMLNRTAKDWFTELRLASPDSQSFRWMLGAYYAEFRIRNRSITGADTDGINLGFGPWGLGSGNQTLGYSDDKNKNTAYAFFGTLDYDVTSALTLSASLRYDEEKKRQTNMSNPGAPDPNDPLLPNISVPIYTIAPGLQRTKKYTSVQPKFTARYAIGNVGSVYATWGRGFKSGGFNPFGSRAALLAFNPATTLQDIYDKEEADTVEIGAKAKLFNGLVRVNLAAFETKTKNAQLLEFIPQLGIQAISTADRVRTRGIEGDAVIRPIDALTLNIGAGYIDPKITRFSSNAAYEGNQRPSTSKYTVNIGAQYDAEITADVNLTARVDYQYQSKTYWDWANMPGSERSGFGLVNGRLAVDKGPLEVAIWGKNIFNKSYNQEVIVLLPIASANWRAAPRTYGLEASYRF